MNSIYIHVPFCVKKCNYCDFFSVTYIKEWENKYVETLCSSILRENTDREIKTLYVGGGTPCILSENSFDKIFNALGAFNFTNDCEKTVEINPGACDGKKLKFLSDYFNRISVGCQSFNDKELKVLGRIHTGNEAIKTVSKAWECGFTNINLDLMYNIPFQTEESFERNVNIAKNLPVNHVSAYELTYEENTPFGKNKTYYESLSNQGNYDKILMDILKEIGIFRYEVSNYAKKGFESMHNLNYWHNGEYLGFGSGAVGYVNGKRYKYIENIKEYIESDGEKFEFSEIVSKKEKAFENLMLGLRMVEGFNIKEITEILNGEEKKAFLDMILKMQDYVVLENNVLKPTVNGMDLLNEVILKLYTWDV